MQKIVCLHVCWVHTSSLCVGKKKTSRQAAVPEKDGQSAAGRKKADMRMPRSTWVREWLSEDRRQQLGHYSTFLTRELCTEDVNAFQNHLRMPRELFDEILERVTSCSHRETRHEVPLCPTTWTEAVSDSGTSGHWRELLVTLLCVSVQSSSHLSYSARIVQGCRGSLQG